MPRTVLDTQLELDLNLTDTQQIFVEGTGDEGRMSLSTHLWVPDYLLSMNS